jgi:hypothetical protein
VLELLQELLTVEPFQQRVCSYDTAPAWCNFTLEHVANPRKACSEEVLSIKHFFFLKNPQKNMICRKSCSREKSQRTRTEAILTNFNIENEIKI